MTAEAIPGICIPPAKIADQEMDKTPDATTARAQPSPFGLFHQSYGKCHRVEIGVFGLSSFPLCGV